MEEKQINLDFVTFERLIMNNICNDNCEVASRDGLSYNQFLVGNSAIRATRVNINTFSIEAKTIDCTLIDDLNIKIDDLIKGYNWYVDTDSITFGRKGSSSTILFNITNAKKSVSDASSPTIEVKIEKYHEGDNITIISNEKAKKTLINVGDETRQDLSKETSVFSNNNTNVSIKNNTEKKKGWISRFFDWVFRKRS